MENMENWSDENNYGTKDKEINLAIIHRDKKMEE